MKPTISILGYLIASHEVIGRTLPDATAGKPPKPSILARLKPRGWTQGPPLGQLSNHIRRDIGLDPIPARDRWSDHRL